MDKKDQNKNVDYKALKKPHYYGVMDGIHVFHGSHEDHKKHIGKHLEHPSEEDFKSGLKDAKSKGLNMLYIHGQPPSSLRSEIHPELGAHVPGDLGKSEDQTKRQAQYWFKLKHPSASIPSNRKNSYVKYEMHASEVKSHADDYDNHADHVLSHVVDHKPEVQNTGIHGTAISRQSKGDSENYIPSTPISDHIASNGAGKGKKILYHGCGRDFGGALALAGHGAKLKRDPLMNEHGTHLKDDSGNPLYHNHKIVGGQNSVEMHDPFHYDKSLTKLPSGKFDEVHSHYTLNVVDHPTGKQIMSDISSKLKPNGKAIITARRDSGMKTNEEWKALNTQASKAKKETPTPKVGQNPLNKADEKKKYDISDLHREVQEEAKKHGYSLPDHIFKPKQIKPKDIKPKMPSQASALGKIESIKTAVREAIKKIEEGTVVLTTKDLAKGLINPEKNCNDCGCEVEGCICFNGFPEPKFNFDGKKLTILFKAEWDEESKEAYLEDFKKRAGRLLKK